MNRSMTLTGIAFALLTATGAALAQSAPPPLPALTPQLSAQLKQRMDLYRRDTDDRVARGEITAGEANRLVSWREWQIARQLAAHNAAPPDAIPYDMPPPDYRENPAPRAYAVEPAPYYGPYYRYPEPYYYGPRAYYWGPTICAGGFGRHFGGSLCF